MADELVVAAVAGLILSTFFTGLSIPLARYVRAVDEPGGIKVHSKPTPRLGGLGLVAGLSVCGWLCGALSPWALAGLLTMAAVGAVDDCRGLDATRKLLGQAAAGAMLGGHFYLQTGSIPQAILGFAFAIGLGNAVNLLDGLDGLAAGSALVSAIGLTVILAFSGGGVAFAAILAASLLGVLFWNYPRARTFMGDIGSTTIGYALALVIVTSYGVGPAAFVGAGLTAAVPVGNTLLAILRRLKHGSPVFKGDREHFFDKIHRGTGSHVKTIWIVYGLTALFSALGLIAVTLPLPFSVLAAVAAAFGCLALAAKLGWLRHGNEAKDVETAIPDLETVDPEQHSPLIKEEERRNGSGKRSTGHFPKPVQANR